MVSNWADGDSNQATNLLCETTWHFCITHGSNVNHKVKVQLETFSKKYKCHVGLKLKNFA
jgi:hypothetical protein